MLGGKSIAHSIFAMVSGIPYKPHTAALIAVLFIVLGLLVVRQPAEAGPGDYGSCDGSSGAYFYWDSNYSGQCLRVSGGLDNFGSVPGDHNDKARSIDLRGIGYIRVCLHADAGNCRTFTEDIPDLAPHSYESSISSAYVWADRWGSCDGRTGAYLYWNASYGGNCLRIFNDVTNLADFTWNGKSHNDQAHSIQFVGISYLRVCLHADAGNCTEFFQSVPNLAPHSYESSISSVYMSPKPTATPAPTITPTPTVTPTTTPPFTEINITNVFQDPLPKTCFDVMDSGQAFLFSVCDNDFQDGFPVSHAACDDGSDTICNDEDPALGSVTITVDLAVYHVEVGKTPLNITADATKGICSGGPTCTLTFSSSSGARPWNPWDVAGPGGSWPPDGIVDLPNDILGVIQHFNQTKP